MPLFEWRFSECDAISISSLLERVGILKSKQNKSDESNAIYDSKY